MSTPRPAAALGVWRARRPRSRADRAFVAYAFALVAVIAIMPVARALWLVATAPAGVALLTSTATAASVSMLTAGLWAGALLAGRLRGPALMPPFPLHALSGSGIPRSVALRRPLLLAGSAITAAFAATAGFVSSVLVAVGRAQPLGIALFVAASAAVGVITTLMWLVGQVLPRTAAPLALGIIIASAPTHDSPQVLAVAPWGWAGSSYPLNDPLAAPLAGLVLLALALLLAAPLLLNSLGGEQLGIQAARWERATMFSFSFEFGTATAAYASGPRFGRRLTAVRPFRRRALVFLVRDAIGQLRTPGRSLVAVGGLVASGIAVTLSVRPADPLLPLAVVAGLVALTSTGALARGLRHAAHVAGDHPLYGISDVSLVLVHALFPFAVVTVVLPSTAIVTALTTGAPLVVSLIGAWVLGLLALTIQLNGALKRPLPPGLLAPISTPAGDLGVLARLAWALSEVIVTACAGLAAAALAHTPLPLALTSLVVAGIAVVRWRRRR